eukprot:Partr_v1_DN23736_c0_g3_i2_m53098 putative Rho GDP dissociation inhibitor (GDI)
MILARLWSCLWPWKLRAARMSLLTCPLPVLYLAYYNSISSLTGGHRGTGSDQDIAHHYQGGCRLPHEGQVPVCYFSGYNWGSKHHGSVQHDVISGLKYLHVVKRKGLKVDKAEEMIGSYAPNATPYEKKFVPEQAPGGMIARGTYTVKSKFTDDDGTSHLEWEWQFQIKKEWE